ncbi:Molybdopterin-synthase adenylyltransferase [Planctomycetes bacterium Pla163]|uniref:Molybdopterin-synthase adenylyltransferase n=1 Tax=Rohdeia mirabilis TaxID=2528008 RepID=A0A518D0X5_9BACT|nr:Molybdopterin-synthase adenylyltransferase [Planctomycetes bacterium Pla163]
MDSNDRSTAPAGGDPEGGAPRFDRQTRFAPLGEAGQARLASARVLVVGCGALGGALAQSLHRSGVGALVLVDRDVVELSNLPRQVLFDLEHARRRVPKVDAARETLERAGGPTRIETHATHLGARELGRLGRTADLILDGTDNLATRYLINDYAVKRRQPWIYGGVVGGSGLVLAVVPGGPCLRCLFPDPPPPGSLATCDSAGVVQPAVAAVAALQAGTALRLLTASPDTSASGPGAAESGAHVAGGGSGARGPEPGPVDMGTPRAHDGRTLDGTGRLLEVDAWNGSVRQLDLTRDPHCPCCGQRRFDFLTQSLARGPEVLCGRNAVEVPGTVGTRLDTEAVVRRLDSSSASTLERSGDLLRFRTDGLTVTLFADGRALVEGTEDVERARAVCDRLLS